MNIRPISVIPMKEQQPKTQQVSENTENSAVNDAVEITPKSRFEPSAKAEEFTTSDMASLMKSILQNPESALNAQSRLTPERVLALLA